MSSGRFARSVQVTDFVKLAEMSALSLVAWRTELGFSQREAASRLGLALKNYQFLEWGENRSFKDRPRPVVMSKRVALACSAISAGLKPVEGWTEDMAATRKLTFRIKAKNEQ